MIKISQSECFGDSIKCLSKNRKLPDSNALSNLSPFIDRLGVLRVGGRLSNSSIPSDHRHPVLLPHNHVITRLLVRHLHESTYHQGETITRGRIREMGFHIYKGSKFIKNLVRNCSTCRKLRAESATQIMADLPPDRIEEVPPFSNVGLDCFGPYFIHDGKATRQQSGSKKVWVMICVCLVSRAIHVELLPSMDTSSCRNALSRFVALRGDVKIIRSDNGTNFTATKKQFKEAGELNSDILQRELASKDIEWKLNPPNASHCGGAWERKIGSIKRVLEATMHLLQNRSLSRDEFHTLLMESASIVNNTPLWGVSYHPDDPCPLTPNSLLTLRESTSSRPEQYSKSDLLSYGRKRWRRIQYLADQFCIRWRKHYLHTLQERKKWKFKKEDFKIDDLVLIKSKTAKRNDWPLGRVVQVCRSRDGCVRSVLLQTKDSNNLYRSIHDLVLISCNEG